ncbi:hypothetical protein NQ318_014279, partial [Aromia moschata]
MLLWQLIRKIAQRRGKSNDNTLLRGPPENYPENTEEVIDAAELENPPLPSKYELEEFGNYIKNIQDTALKIVKLQEIAKSKGKLSESEEAKYKQHMESLNKSAQSLAEMQEESNPLDFESREGLGAWFERRAASSNKKDKNKKKEEEDKKRKEEERKRKEEESKKKKDEEEKRKKEEEKKKKEEEDKKRKEEEEKRKEEEKEEEIDEEEEDNDSITINLPPEDASVAEAKPVGLAVAGEGGVAASKPIATAVVGPGGLAIARPVGTAIAGVSPEQALVPIYVEGYTPGKKPTTTSGNKQISSSEFLSRLI